MHRVSMQHRVSRVPMHRHAVSNTVGLLTSCFYKVLHCVYNLVVDLLDFVIRMTHSLMFRSSNDASGISRTIHEAAGVTVILKDSECQIV